MIFRLLNRCLVAKLRKLEREMYLVQKMVSEDVYGENLSGEIEHLDAQVMAKKNISLFYFIILYSLRKNITFFFFLSNVESGK